jgi:hypothetical protein
VVTKGYHCRYFIAKGYRAGSLYFYRLSWESKGSDRQNALDLIALLWGHVDNEDAVTLLKLVSTSSSSKECIIALQEVQEILLVELSSWDQEDHEDDTTAHDLVDHSCVLIGLYSAGESYAISVISSYTTQSFLDLSLGRRDHSIRSSLF